MKSTDLDREIRRQRRFEKLRTDEPRCAACGFDDDRALELHHVAGRKNDSLVVIVCCNCHRALSDDQCDHSKADTGADQYFVGLGNFLLGLADMLRLIVERLARFGRELIDRAAIGAGGAA